METERKKFKKVPTNVALQDLTPLNISCSTTKCDDELHYFRTTKTSLKKHGKAGVCQECGTDLIDWQRVHKNNIKDSKFVFDSLRKELIRHVFWHTPIDDKAIKKASESSREEIRATATKFIKQRIGKLNGFDGRQTPLGDGQIVNYAQHATATCCRKCLETWHNIPREPDLTEDQIKYCTDLIMLYVEERLQEHLN